MKLPLGYILAFIVLLPPLGIWLGGDCVRRDVVEQCVACKSQRHASERHWCIWGFSGQEEVVGDILASRVLRDFPDFACEHCWRDQSEVTSHPWDGPLWRVILPPRKQVDWMMGMPPPVACYEENDVFRQRVLDVIEDGAVSRGAMLDWLSGDASGSEDPKEEAALRRLERVMYGSSHWYWPLPPLDLPPFPRLKLDAPGPWPSP